MKVRLDNHKLYLDEYTEKEYTWVKETLTWYHRAGSLRKLSEGDFLQLNKNKKKIGQFLGYPRDGRLTVQWLKGKQEEIPVFDVTPVESETLLLSDENRKPYVLPGLLAPFQKSAGFPIVLTNPPTKDYTRHKVDPSILPGITLAGFQEAGANKCLTLKRGLVIIPTAGGKTEVMLSVLRYLIDSDLLTRAVIIVPGTGLSEQFQERAFGYGFTKEEVGVVNQGHKGYNSKIVVCTPDSFSAALKDRADWVMNLISEANFGMFDECHHLRSDSWLEITEHFKDFEYLLGFSGSPFLVKKLFENSGDTLIWGLTGGPIYEITHSYLRKINWLPETIVLMDKISGNRANFKGRFQKIEESFIIKNGRRNERIVLWAQRFADNGFQVLILVKRIMHAELLMKLMGNKRCISVFGAKSGLTYEDNGELVDTSIDYNAFRQAFKEKKYDIVIGSTVMDEGMDMPAVGALIMGGGGKSRIKNNQRTGRGQRKKANINRVYQVDFIDQGHVYLMSHSKKRRELYQEMDCTVIEDEFLFYNQIIAHGKQLKVIEAREKFKVRCVHPESGVNEIVAAFATRDEADAYAEQEYKRSDGHAEYLIE